MVAESSVYELLRSVMQCAMPCCTEFWLFLYLRDFDDFLIDLVRELEHIKRISTDHKNRKMDALAQVVFDIRAFEDVILFSKMSKTCVFSAFKKIIAILKILKIFPLFLRFFDLNRKRNLVHSMFLNK